MMRKDFQEVERSKIKKSEKMMRKDVSRSQRSKFKKSVSCWMLWKMKKIKEIMMRCDSVEKFCFFIDALAHSPISAHSLISDSKRHHNSLLEFFFVIDALAHSPISAHSLISLMTEKWWEKTFQEVERSKFKKSEKMIRKDFQEVERSKIKKS
jgi:CRISPR/Cas system-associated endoribonuclease Cas2